MDNTSDIDEKYAIDFLSQDFNQCFQQMRHYDAQIIDTFKFLFTMYSALIGISLTLYQIGIQMKLQLEIPGIALLSIGFILGTFMLIIVVRNRAYFVQVTRYINEQRDLFLSFKPAGFENRAGMYTNACLPAYFDWRSSHLFYVYIISVFNAIMTGALAYMLGRGMWTIFGTVIGISFTEILVCSFYLRTRENKKAESAIFGGKAL